MKQLIHDVRVNFIDTDSSSQTIQNNFSHSFSIEDPENYISGVMDLTGAELFSVDQINFIYVTSDAPFRFIVNGDNELITNHISLINLDLKFNILIESVTSSNVSSVTNIKYLHGKLPITTA